jgi:hypothetical protein
MILMGVLGLVLGLEMMVIMVLWCKKEVLQTVGGLLKMFTVRERMWAEVTGSAVQSESAGRL